jgi:DNA-binding MarR family transcriptional regulator
MVRPPRPRRQDPGPRQVADRLHSAAIHLLRRLRSSDAASGLTAPQGSAVSVLVFGGPVTLSRLAAIEQVRPPTMTRLVAELERRGMVTREPDARDGRKVWVRATEEGRRLLVEGRARRVARLEADLRDLPPAEFARLARVVETLERVARPPVHMPPKTEEGEQ